MDRWRLLSTGSDRFRQLRLAFETYCEDTFTENFVFMCLYICTQVSVVPGRGRVVRDILVILSRITYVGQNGKTTRELCFTVFSAFFDVADEPVFL